MIAGLGLAFLVGAAAAFVNFFLSTGSSAKAVDRPAVVRTIDRPGA